MITDGQGLLDEYGSTLNIFGCRVQHSQDIVFPAKLKKKFRSLPRFDSIREYLKPVFCQITGKWTN